MDHARHRGCDVRVRRHRGYLLVAAERRFVSRKPAIGHDQFDPAEKENAILHLISTRNSWGHRAMAPSRPPKIIHPDRRVEEIAARIVPDLNGCQPR